MENKQTAVEWLIKEIESKGDAWENASIRRLQISIDVSEYLDLKRQAKAMERKQHQNTWDESIPFLSFDNYFTKTYQNGENS